MPHAHPSGFPPPCCGLPKPREGQALALRYREGDWALGRSRGTGPRATVKKRRPFIVGRGTGPRHAAVYRNLARDRPSHYEIGKVLGPSDAREGQALARRYREGAWALGRSRGTGPRATVKNGVRYRRAGACPPPCCGLPRTREGQALALRYREGDWAIALRSKGTHRDREVSPIGKVLIYETPSIYKGTEIEDSRPRLRERD